MCKECCWNVAVRDKQESLDKSLFTSQFIHHKRNMDSPAIILMPPRLQARDSSHMKHGTATSYIFLDSIGCDF